MADDLIPPEEMAKFWKWLIQKERKRNHVHDNRDREKFEPIPLYVELEKPDKHPKEKEDQEISTDYEVDYTIDVEIYKV